MRLVASSALVLSLVLSTAAHAAPASSASPVKKLTGGDRAVFNRCAAERFEPVFWRTDANKNKALDPGELVVLWGVAGGGKLSNYVDEGGGFTPRMTTLWECAKPALRGALGDARKDAVTLELAQGRPTLIETSLKKDSAEDKAVVAAILDAAKIIEDIYALQNGVAALASKIPADDKLSAALFYRNQGPRCEAPKTEKDDNCNALADKPKSISGLYPANMQNGVDTKFCQALEKRKDADALLAPFVVVQAKKGGKSTGNAATDDLIAVPYSDVYKEQMGKVSALLKSAADAIKDPKEAALKAYLSAASTSFVTNDWVPADEAWAAMNASNSKWYLRIGPDETYFEPCSVKSGFHVSFARINQDSLAWQKKLEPVKQDMEKALAAMAGAPYAAREVSFHLPDFIDIVVNAGDSRNAHGATIGQSLPNFGKVASENRGRTVVMTNLYTDKDSEDAWLAQASSLLCKATQKKIKFDPKAGVMSTVLHEAAHNLGPSHDYKVDGKKDDQVFGGALASMLEELKAQTSAMYLADFLAKKKVVTAAQAERAHLGDVTWAFGHIAQGMYTNEGKPKAYSHLAAIEMGFLFEQGVLKWNANDKAANGADVGCFDVDLKKWPAQVESLEAQVLHIKGAGDKAAAEALRKKHVDDAGEWSKLRAVIAERWLRAPKATFVYAVTP